MAPASRSCMGHHAWRYVALVGVVGCIITSLVPLDFDERTAGLSTAMSIIGSGWFFLGLFWNIFVIAWETGRKEQMHPAAVVSLDLIMWLYGIYMVFQGVWSVVIVAIEWNLTMNDPRLHRWDVSENDKDNATADFAVFLVCAVPTTIIHFALFVEGCVNEDRRLKAIKAAKNADFNNSTIALPTGDDEELLDAKAAAAAGSYREHYNSGLTQDSSHLTVRSPPSYLSSMNSAVAAKQAEIEEQERAFGNGNATTGYGYPDDKAARNW